MAWWRHDPSLWARSPGHRYAERVIRDHEAVLRTRCFSRMPHSTARNQYLHSTTRPEGMTDREWMQLQRYRKWRRMLQQHPYKGLFGASEDMLRGKGLTDWDWVYKTFPKWMLQEMDPQESVSQDKGAMGRNTGHEDGYGSQTQADIDQQTSARRPTSFAQPGVRTKHYERDELGIVSPSDLRRPWEGGISTGAKPPDLPETYDRELGDSKSWRQTSLQRRSAPSIETGSRTGSSSPAKPDVSAKVINNPVTFTIPSSQALVDNYPYPRITLNSDVKSNATEEASRGSFETSKSKEATPDNDTTLRADLSPAARSTSDKLRNLPADDIDFLSAEEIRASMGRKRRTATSEEGKELDRQKLEVDYITAKPKALDEAVEGHVLNNYYVRRTQQELERARPATQDTQKDSISTEQSSPMLQSEPVEIESSINRMKRWIEEGGVSLAKHFWQDPIEPGTPSEADMQFFKQLAGLTKARRAKELISDDLETDIPMCKGLLERLKNDENKVEHAALRLRTPQKVVHGAEVPKNLRTIKERRLRNTYERTEKQLQVACQALRDLDNETIQKSTNAFKRRLGIASRILHKNHTLTRMLTWGAQARLDDPRIEKTKAERYGDLLTSLATLRDTQLALARLMDHAIQTYGVSFKPADEALSKPVLASEPRVSGSSTELESPMLQTAGTNFLAQTAAEAYLTDEVQSHKAAMQGLSDDGYARESKASSLRMLEEKSPLTDSLFRPFTSQLENLGNKANKEQVVEVLEENPQQEVQDQALVQEVRNAYEDVYGPITSEHRQVSQVDQCVSTQVENPMPLATLEADQRHLRDVAVDEGTSVAAAAELKDKGKARLPVENAKVASANITKASTDVGATAENSSFAYISADVTKDPGQERSSNDDISAVIPDTVTAETEKTTTATSTLPTHYTILIYDPRTDKMSITTSKSERSHDTSAAVPIHQALSSLKDPARFVPYITPGLEIVSVRKNMLVLRNALDEELSTRGFETISPHPSVKTNADSISSQTNPIDGTSRLSPTGYSGVEQSREQLETDFEERRQESAATDARAWSERGRQQSKEGVPGRSKGTVSGVLKAAIWASAACYVIGVTAEVFR